MSLMRFHREPDFDERDEYEQQVAEDEWGRGLCKRCGHATHKSSRCPHINYLWPWAS